MSATWPGDTRDHKLESIGRLLAEDPKPSLRELMDRLWRRRRMILLGTMLGLLAAIGISESLTPGYVATAEVVVNPGQGNILKSDNRAPASPSSEAEALQNEVYMLRSRGVAALVINRLGLLEDSEFSPVPSWGDRLAALGRQAGSLLGRWFDQPGAAAADAAPPAPDQPKPVDRTRVVDQFLQHLDVTLEGRSRVIRVAFASRDPEKASRIVNALAETYIANQVASKTNAIRHARDRLNRQVAQLREKMLRSDRAVEAFREEANLVQGREGSIYNQEISERMAQVVRAGTRRAEAEAKLRQVEPLLSSPDQLAAIADVLQSQVVQTLRVQEVEAQRRAAEFAKDLGELHPKTVKVREEIRQLRGAIMREVDKIVLELRNDMKIAAAQEAAQRSDLRSLNEEVAVYNRAEVQLRAIEHEAEINREIYRTFLEEAERAGAQENIQEPDAQVISRADVPSQPFFPRKTLFAVFGMISGCLAGAALGLGLEQMDSSIRSRRQLEQALGVNVFGLVPAVKSRRRKGDHLAVRAFRNPMPALVEAYRTIFTGLVLACPDRKPVLLVCSALPGEGKTSAVLSLALVAAQAGRSSVIVDSDFRRPTAHRAFGAPLTPGLTEFLSGKATMNEILHEVAPGVVLIPAGKTPENPTALLSGNRMGLLLQMLSGSYDLVLLDSAPVLVVSDTLILLRQVDSIVQVVRWGHTPKDVAIAAASDIQQHGGQLSGAILSMVDFGNRTSYGSTESNIYRNIKKYYIDQVPSRNPMN